MRFSITISVLSLLASCNVIMAQPIDVSIPFDNSQYQIKGTYLKAEKSNGNAVLMIAGSGPTDRDCNNSQMKSNSYKYLAEHLATKGISSLRYDKLGIAQSIPGIPEEKLVFYDNVLVAKTVYDFLLQQKGVERIVIMGHSEGSLVGMLAAKVLNAYKYISLAGPGYPADEILRTQLGKMPSEELKLTSLAMLDTLKTGKPIKKFDPRLFTLFRPSMNNYLIDWFKYDPREVIAELKMPVLIWQGDNDIQVSKDNAEALHNANEKTKLVISAGINHVLKNAPTDFEENYKSYNSPDVDIAEEMKKALVDFILE